MARLPHWPASTPSPDLDQARTIACLIACPIAPELSIGAPTSCGGGPGPEAPKGLRPGELSPVSPTMSPPEAPVSPPGGPRGPPGPVPGLRPAPGPGLRPGATTADGVLVIESRGLLD